MTDTWKLSLSHDSRMHSNPRGGNTSRVAETPATAIATRGPNADVDAVSCRVAVVPAPSPSVTEDPPAPTRIAADMALSHVIGLAVGSAPELVFCAPGWQVLRRSCAGRPVSGTRGGPAPLAGKLGTVARCEEARDKQTFGGRQGTFAPC